MTPSSLSLLTAAIPFACAALLVTAAATDLAARIIPNRIPALLLALGLVLHVAQGTLVAGLLVAAAVFVFAFVAWQFGAMGGGDVKLLAATAFCIAPPAALALIVRVAIAGGVLGILYLVARRVVRAPAGPVPRLASLPARVLRAERWRIGRRFPLPYGIAIAVGGLITLI